MVLLLSTHVTDFCKNRILLSYFWWVCDEECCRLRFHWNLTWLCTAFVKYVGNNTTKCQGCDFLCCQVHERNHIGKKQKNTKRTLSLTHPPTCTQIGDQCLLFCGASIKAGVKSEGTNTKEMKLHFISLKDKQCQDVLVNMFNNCQRTKGCITALTASHLIENFCTLNTFSLSTQQQEAFSK